MQCQGTIRFFQSLYIKLLPMGWALFWLVQKSLKSIIRVQRPIPKLQISVKIKHTHAHTKKKEKKIKKKNETININEYAFSRCQKEKKHFFRILECIAFVAGALCVNTHNNKDNNNITENIFFLKKSTKTKMQLRRKPLCVFFVFVCCFFLSSFVWKNVHRVTTTTMIIS